VFFSKALECFDKRVLKILDTHDVFGDRYKMYLRQGLRPQWYSISPSAERAGLNRADIVFAIQDQERQVFSSLTAKPVVTVGHIVALSALTAPPVESNILYVGSRNRINVESVERFIAQILPLVRERVPSAVLLVAGGVSDELGQHDAVFKCGRVERLEQVYASARVVVNPMAFGTGLKIKNLEALGYAKPLVTTGAGADGLEDGVGSAFLVADEPADFADAVVKMLSDDQVNAAFCHAAYQYASAWNEKVFTALNAAVTKEITR
jgi:glycosyltransferase involved in cell wall biosynthesis